MEMDWNETLASFIDQIGTANRTKNDCDYVNEEGLLTCGICGEPKEQVWRKTVGDQTYTKVIARTCRCDLEKAKARAEAEAKAEAKKEVKRLRRASLMDVRLEDATFDTFERTKFNAQNMDICRRYVERFDEMVKANQGLLFWGGVGTGKTFAAACIANELMNRGVPAIMTSFIRLIDIMRDGGEETDRLMNRVISCKLLILDDLGAERNTSFAMEKVFDVIDRRYQRRLPMVITTNLTYDEMASTEDRIYDRILEVCYPMQWSGPSMRLKRGLDKEEKMKVVLGIG